LHKKLPCNIAEQKNKLPFYVLREVWCIWFREAAAYKMETFGMNGFVLKKSVILYTVVLQYVTIVFL